MSKSLIKNSLLRQFSCKGSVRIINKYFLKELMDSFWISLSLRIFILIIDRESSDKFYLSARLLSWKLTIIALWKKKHKQTNKYIHSSVLARIDFWKTKIPGWCIFLFPLSTSKNCIFNVNKNDFLYLEETQKIRLIRQTDHNYNWSKAYENHLFLLTLELNLTDSGTLYLLMESMRKSISSWSVTLNH